MLGTYVFSLYLYIYYSKRFIYQIFTYYSLNYYINIFIVYISFILIITKLFHIYFYLIAASCLLCLSSSFSTIRYFSELYIQQEVGHVFLMDNIYKILLFTYLPITDAVFQEEYILVTEFNVSVNISLLYYII